MHFRPIFMVTTDAVPIRWLYLLFGLSPLPSLPSAFPYETQIKKKEDFKE